MRHDLVDVHVDHTGGQVLTQGLHRVAILFGSGYFGARVKA